MTRRVLLFGAFDMGAGYPRARSLVQGLESHGVEVFLLHEAVLPVRGDRLRCLSRPWRWPGTGLRLWGGRRRLRRSLRAMIAEHDFDAVIVPYPGWFSVVDARRLFDGPVLLDLFLSLSSTAVGDRGLFRQDGIVDRALRGLDRRACRAADRVLLDTPQHADLVARMTGVGRDRFSFVPIGDPDAPAAATPPPALDRGEPLRALYLGTGIPLHGVATILEAVERTEGVVLSFVGGRAQDRRAVRALGPDRVGLVAPWVDPPAATDLFETHHLAFGIFGAGEKARRVVPYKVVHALAHGRPSITAETPAVETLLVPGDDCLTVPAADPAALARALSGVRDGPRILGRVGSRARRRYELTFAPAAIGRRLLLSLEQVTGSPWLADAPALAAVASS